ncbi:MAG: general stress protein CsbD [Bacteroidales bacterium]|nr:general stress protein CsbD [Bacteroidales bacterium]
MITSGTKGYWNEKKMKLRQKYPVLTDDDLCYSDGKEKVMLEILSYKLGVTEHEMVRILVDL